MRRDGDRKTCPVCDALCPGADEACSPSRRTLLLTETKDWRALAIRAAAALCRLRGIIHQRSNYNQCCAAVMRNDNAHAAVSRAQPG